MTVADVPLVLAARVIAPDCKIELFDVNVKLLPFAPLIAPAKLIPDAPPAVLFVADTIKFEPTPVKLIAPLEYTVELPFPGVEVPVIVMSL